MAIFHSVLVTNVIRGNFSAMRAPLTKTWWRKGNICSIHLSCSDLVLDANIHSSKASSSFCAYIINFRIPCLFLYTGGVLKLALFIKIRLLRLAVS